MKRQRVTKSLFRNLRIIASRKGPCQERCNKSRQANCIGTGGHVQNRWWCHKPIRSAFNLSLPTMDIIARGWGNVSGETAARIEEISNRSWDYLNGYHPEERD